MATDLTSESTLRMKDGFELYYKIWHVPTSTSLRARLAFVHGFSDHVNFQNPLFELLAEQGIETHGIDQRGWGRSVKNPGQKGLTGPTTQVLEDLTTFFETVLSTPLPTSDTGSKKAVPFYIMGHSMGGGEVLTYMTTGPSEVLKRIRGFLVASPWVSLHPHTQPSNLLITIGRIASQFLPRFQKLNRLDLKTISRDQSVGERIKADPLCHGTGTLEGLAGALDRAANLDSGRWIVQDGIGEGGKTRLWMGHGTVDAICWFDSAKGVYERAQAEDKEFRAYEGWFHKLHMEIGECKTQFAGDVAKWILDRAD